MSRRSRTQNGFNRPLALFATILVVGGVAAVVYVSSQVAGTDRPAVSIGTVSSTSSGVSSTSTSGAVVLANDAGFTLDLANGTSEKWTFTQFADRVPLNEYPYEGVSVATAVPVYFRVGASATSSAAGIPSPDAKLVAQMDAPKADGASVLSLIRIDEAPQSFVLRIESGKALQDATMLGWLDESNIALLSRATSSRAIYAVSILGVVRSVAVIPDSALTIQVRHGSVWYATGVMGQGIESNPAGPSELHRVSLDGTDTLVSRDELHIFLSAIPGPDNRLAFTTDDGQSFVVTMGSSASRIALGKRRPLIFLPNGQLIVRDGFEIASFDPKTQKSTKLGDVPEGTVNVFFLP